MENLFEKQEMLYKIADRIENELNKLTGFNFPRPQLLYFLILDKKITEFEFDKAFNLMFEYRKVTKELIVVNAEIEKIEKELKQ